MTSIEIDIPDSVLETSAKEQIAKLEKDLKNALERERKLKVRLAKYQGEEKLDKKIRFKLEEFISDVGEDLDIHDGCREYC